MRSPEHAAHVQSQLLDIARQAIFHGLTHGEPDQPEDELLEGELARMGASFVTLTRHGELRGCMGSLEAVRPLGLDVAHVTYRSAFEDPRFNPVVMRELPGMSVEIAVLSPLEPMSVSGRQALLEQLVPDVDGLVVDDGYHRATFLPKVWAHLPEPEDFLDALWSKAGLAPRAWPASLQAIRYSTSSVSGAVLARDGGAAED